jgi:hypothetical protein
MSFFDRHGRFFETSTVGTQGRRLQNRYKAVIDSNREIFAGSNVLDLGSHDGRWSLAALDAGASGVVGVEARSELVERANATFEHYRASEYLFIVQDVFDALAKVPAGAFDVILCLGFLYHTPRHYELFELLWATRPKYVVLDTTIDDDAEAFTRFARECTDGPGRGTQSALGRIDAIIGVPSRGMIEGFSEYFGFGLEEIDWQALGIDDWTGCEDYRDGSRRTYLLRSEPECT